MNTDTVGVYGNYYLKRAILSQQGLARTWSRMPFTRSISATNPQAARRRQQIHDHF